MGPISAEASRGSSHLISGTSKRCFTPWLQLKMFPDINKSYISLYIEYTVDVRCSFRPDSHLPRAEALIASAAQSVDSASLCWPALGPRQLPHPKSHSLPRGSTHLLMSHCQYRVLIFLASDGDDSKEPSQPESFLTTEFFLCSALLPSPPPTPQALILAALPSQHPA